MVALVTRKQACEKVLAYKRQCRSELDNLTSIARMEADNKLFLLEKTCRRQRVSLAMTGVFDTAKVHEVHQLYVAATLRLQSCDINSLELDKEIKGLVQQLADDELWKEQP